ncbi:MULTISPECIES: OmpA family protein [unclassified Photobacterium]|uniref:OmpA family protein n=1 Tax=unclassified Photobacterium TaxID=2628852 RepID=UPI001EDDA476|nr:MULTISPECIES: OmpA family protein [unclassified Photobacterium]MCG3865477.1 OmpA family protein [Photobacterium sp. Ph6]MCG3876990.1 OmpA family protein [Photobacterium sp. Ph5]
MKVILFILLVSAFVSGCVSDRVIYADYGKLACQKSCPEFTALLWPSVINFDFNKSDIAISEKDKVVRVAKILKDYPEYSIAIIGSADPYGTDSYNNELSLRRSITVGKALQAKGIAQTRIVLIGTGESELYVNTKDRQKNRANRRTQLVLLDANHNPVDLYFDPKALPSEPIMMNKVNSL